MDASAEVPVLEVTQEMSVLESVETLQILRFQRA